MSGTDDAWHAWLHGVLVHAFACMSNHPHEVITDVHGVLPDFLRDFHRELALAAKTLYQIPENLWCAEKPSAVELHGAPAQLEAALYTMLNPVAAGLVARAAQWPGAIALPSTRRIEARRPDVWFSAEDRPELLTLELTPPPARIGTDAAWHAWLDHELARREEDIARERAKRRTPFLGRTRVLARHPFDRPRNADALLPSRHPTLKTSGDGPLMRFAIAVLREWRRAYREARERWRLDKTAGFPAPGGSCSEPGPRWRSRRGTGSTNRRASRGEAEVCLECGAAVRVELARARPTARRAI